MRTWLFVLIACFLFSCAEKSYLEAADFIACGDFNSYQYFCDARDNAIYKFVKINKQIWMAENLRYNSETSKCYGDVENCDGNGRLYQFNANTDDEDYVELCPKGWRLPSEDDWAELEFYAEDEQLKAEVWGGSNDYGFNALPVGVGFYAKDCPEEDGAEITWIEWYGQTIYTAFMGDNAISKRVLESDDMNSNGCLARNSYVSVRCIKE